MNIAIAAKRAAGVISLGGPDLVHRLGTEDCQALRSAYDRFARDPIIYALVVRSQYDGAFADGLDVREMAETALSGPQAAAGAIGEMLRACWQQECFTKPIVSLIDGHVEGGGPGISLHGTHRVAGERYRFACAATGVGLVPAGGLGHVLARLGNSVGAYLALTGHGIGRGDAFRHGLVTHCIEARHFGAIEEHLADADPVDPVVDGFHMAPDDASLAEYEPVIARCFSADTVEDILGRLDGEAGHDDWARQVAADLRRRSPLALKVSLELLKKARGLDLRSYLILEHSVLAHLAARPDVRRAILEGTAGETGMWDPASLAAVTEGQRAAVLSLNAIPALALRARSDVQTQD
jgi:enoyl-CoA hydratase